MLGWVMTILALFNKKKPLKVMKFAIKTMEKNIFFYSVLLCLYNVYKHQIGGNFNKKIDICFFKKCLEQKRGSQKV